MVKLPIFALAFAMTNGLVSAQDFHYRFCKPIPPPISSRPIADHLFPTRQARHQLQPQCRSWRHISPKQPRPVRFPPQPPTYTSPSIPKRSTAARAPYTGATAPRQAPIGNALKSTTTSPGDRTSTWRRSATSTAGMVLRLRPVEPTVIHGLPTVPLGACKLRYSSNVLCVCVCLHADAVVVQQGLLYLSRLGR